MIGDLVNLRRLENTVRRIDGKFLERAVLLEHRRLADRKKQIGHPLARGDHRGKQSVYEFFVHKKPEKLP